MRAGLAVASLALLAGCTSSGDGDRSPATTSVPPPSSVPATAAASLPATTTSPATGAPSSSPLDVLDGAYLLAGSDPDTARLYRVGGGRVLAAPAVAGVTSVATGNGTVVVGRDTEDAETVQQLRGDAAVGIGIRSGFAPAVSRDGALAYAVLGGSTTPGISKPGGVSVRVRTTLTGADRVVRTFPVGTSVLGTAWSGDDLVVAVSDGEAGSLLAFPGGRGRGTGLARGISSADSVVLVGGAGRVAVSGDGASPAQVVTLPSGRPDDLTAGWQPVCFTGGGVLVVARGAQLATVDPAVTGSGKLAAPRVIGRAPATVIGGSCG